MPLSREQRELLEYLQAMLNGLNVNTYSENLELIIEAIDAALLEAGETGQPSGDDANGSPTTSDQVTGRVSSTSN